MNFKKLLLIFSILILYSGCITKDKFYGEWYNSIQKNNDCKTSVECKNKRIYQNIYNEAKRVNYFDYKNGIK